MARGAGHRFPGGAGGAFRRRGGEPDGGGCRRRAHHRQRGRNSVHSGHRSRLPQDRLLHRRRVHRRSVPAQSVGAAQHDTRPGDDGISHPGDGGPVRRGRANGDSVRAEQAEADGRRHLLLDRRGLPVRPIHASEPRTSGGRVGVERHHHRRDHRRIDDPVPGSHQAAEHAFPIAARHQRPARAECVHREICRSQGLGPGDERSAGGGGGGDAPHVGPVGPGGGVERGRRRRGRRERATVGRSRFRRRAGGGVRVHRRRERGEPGGPDTPAPAA